LSITPEGAGSGAGGTDSSHRPALLIDAVKQRWRLIAIITAFCIIAAVAYGQVRHKQYVAETKVIIYPVAGTPFFEQQTGSQLNDLLTEAQTVRSDEVANAANQLLQEKGYSKLTLGGLISRVSATPETNAQVLRISYTAGTPVRARDGADAFAAAYLDYRQTLAQQAAVEQQKPIAAQRSDAQQALSADRDKLQTLSPGSTAYERTQAQITQVEKQLVDLRTQATDIQRRSVLPGEVLSPATLPSAPHGISGPILAGFGFLLGLLIGTIAAVARERMVGTIRRARALPDEPAVLAVIPPMRATEPVLLSQPTHRGCEAYRLLALAVDATLPTGNPANPWGRLVVVSSLDEAASPVAVNLASALAESGRLCTYVEALPQRSSPRLPALHVDAAPGLADAVLTGGDPIALRTPVSPRFSVLPAGNDIVRASETYGGPRTHRVLEALRRSADIVVVAAPPLTDPDGQALAIEADTVVLVAQIGAATFNQLADTVTEAKRVRASILGVVAFHASRGSTRSRTERNRGDRSKSKGGSRSAPRKAQRSGSKSGSKSGPKSGHRRDDAPSKQDTVVT
jgi:succinoglycan biosynthesis transport protein ExoP